MEYGRKIEISDIKTAIMGAIIAFIFVSTFNHGVIQSCGYFYFCVHKDSYVIVKAEIKEIKKYSLTYRKADIFGIKKALVSYQIGNELHEGYTIEYPEKEEGDTIAIAVKNNKIKRCEKYQFTDEDKILFRTILEILIFSYLFLFIISQIDKLYRKKHIHQVENRTKKAERKKQHDMELEIKKKQEQLLHICKGNVEKNLKKMEEIKDAMQRYEMQWNGEWLWCLTNIYPEEQFLLGKEEGEYKFIALTLDLKKQGMPMEYYVIGQEKDYVYCCKCDSMRVYAFSKSLGITNTPYADIYDYLIKVFA